MKSFLQPVSGWSKRILLFIFVSFLSNSLMAQKKTNITILSAVDESPLMGVTLQLVGSANKNIGWVTDFEGKVSIAIDNPSTIRISSLGFITIEKTIVPERSITIRLQEDATSLDEIVVTGAFIPTTSSKSLYKVKTLSASVIKERGSVNLADVLQTELNLKTIQDDVLGTRIVMQGISGPNVKILIDGVPMVNGAGGEFDLSQINMNNVARVEIVEGPLSVQYGTNALAGTINIITKAHEKESVTANVSGYYETVGQYNTDFSASKGWKNTSLSLGGSRNQFDGFSSTGERSENWVPKTQYLMDAKLKTAIKSLNITGAHKQMWQSSTNRGNATPAFNNITNRISEIANDDYNDVMRLNSSITANGKLSNNDYLNLVNGISIFKQSSNRYLQDVIDDIKWKSTNPENHNETTFTSWTFRGTYVNGNTKEKEGVYLTAGYEASINYADGGRINEDANGKVNEYGFFGAAEIPIGSKIKIQPAFRYLYSNSYDAKDIDFLNANLPILPSLNIMYSNGTAFDIRASYGKGYRTPSVRELYYEFIDANHYIVGNTNLLPELGNSINLSSNWRTKLGKNTSAVFSPSLFFSKIKNKIDLIQIIDRENVLPDDVPNSVPVARIYENIPNFKSYGFNLTSKLVFQNGLKLTPGFGMLARSGSEADDKFYYSYESNLNASYFLSPINTKLNLFYKYNGSIAEFSKGEDGSIGVLTLDDYHTLDASASRSFLNGHLSVTAGAKNIFDVTDISLSGDGSKGLVLQTGREAFYPISWGQTFFLKINYTIK